jgi:hypothetical protein
VTTITTREEWLHRIAEVLTTRYAGQDVAVPDRLQLSCGFPSTRALSKKKRRLGECWYATAAKDGVNQIFVTPLVDDALEAAGIVAHELLHAALPEGAGHGKEFRAAMKKVGLTGHPTSAGPGEDLNKWLEERIKELGPYPNGAIDPMAVRTGPKKQTTRLVKIWCPENKDHKDYILRGTKRALEIGVPTCPACKKLMVVDEGTDDDNE